MIKFADLYHQYQTIKDEIDAAIGEIIRRSAFISGEAAEAFEREFAAHQECGYCVGVANGTDAIEIVLEALSLPRDSEIIVPANTFIATSEAVTRAGHRVVFADVDPVTNTLDPADVSRRITGRTAAIVAVHLYGQPCRMDELLSISRSRDLKLVEDCAQAHGAEYRGRRVGALGVAGTFSFYPGKNLGAYGDAGAITTASESLARKCRMIANHGRTAKYDHQFEGRNSRLDGLQAAILRVKLRHLESWTKRRIRIAAIYGEGLAGVGDLVLPCALTETRHVFHLYVIQTARRDELAKFLRERDIQTGIHYPIALPKLQAYAYLGQANESLVANRVDSTLLSLPMGEHLSDEEARAVVESVREFFSPKNAS